MGGTLFSLKKLPVARVQSPKLAMRVLFVAIPKKSVTNTNTVKKAIPSTYKSKKDALTQRNSNKQTKSASSTVRCGVLSDRQFACSAAAQHCVGSSTKQQTNQANTQQAIIIIIIDR